MANKMDGQTLGSTSGAECDENTSLFDTSTHSLSVNRNKLEWDGTTYRWIGTYEELKSFIENDMKLSGTWRAPGGEIKHFKTDDELSIKWHSRKSKKIVISKDDDEELLSNKLKAFINILPTVNEQESTTSKIQVYDTALKNAADCSGMLFTEFFNNESHSNGKCPEDIEQSIDDRFNDTHLKIKSMENKILTVLDKVTDINTEINEIKSQTLTSAYEKRLTDLEEINRKLEADNEKLTEKFIASTCVVSDLNTKIKDLENEKMCLLTTIKLIQIQDKHFVDADTSTQPIEVDLDINTGKDIHDGPVRVILSETDEEDTNKQIDQQHSLKRKYKSNKK